MKRLTSRRQRSVCIDHLEGRTYFAVTFNTPTTQANLSSITSIAVGDLDGSGSSDVVASGVNSATSTSVIEVFLSSGGSLGKPTLYPLSSNQPEGVTIGDFIGNGKQDIAAVDGQSIDIFLNDGTGTLSPGVGAGIGADGTSIVAGNFRNSGKDDLAVVVPSQNTVETFFSRGDTFASFVAGQSLSVPSPVKVVEGDLNGDGVPDLAILSSNGSVYVALNNGSGNFSAPVQYSPGSAFTSLSDIAIDTGSPDGDIIVVGSTSSGSDVGILPNSGDGTFGAANDVAVTATDSILALGNFGNTGGTDIATLGINGSLDVLVHGTTFGSFSAPDQVFTNQAAGAGGEAATGDFNGDGSPDIAYIVPSSGELAITTNGKGTANNGGGGTTSGSSNLKPTLTRPLPAGPLIAGVRIRPIHERIVVTNSASTAYKGAVVVQLIASTSTIPSSSDAVLGSITRTLSFRGHQSRSFNFTVSSLPASLSGTYYFDAKITDNTQAVATVSSTTNLAVETPAIDLTGTFASVPATAQAGQRAGFFVAIDNAGNVPTPAAFEVKIYASTDGKIDSSALLIDDFAERRKVVPGKTVLVHISKVVSNSAQKIYLIADLDPTDALGESKTSNNAFVSSQITVG